MNNDLLINMYKLLKYCIKQNEEDLVTYNNMVANGDINEERADFCNKMKPVVDNFYALKPYYVKYRDNPTHELEIEIMEKFGALLDEFKSKGKIERTVSEEINSEEEVEEEEEVIEESSETEEPKKKEFPSLEDSGSEEEPYSEEKSGKKPFPSLDGSTSKEMIDDLRSRTEAIEDSERDETPAEESLFEDTSNLNFTKFNGKETSSKLKAVPFFKRLTGFGKEIVEGIKEGIALTKEAAAERKKEANVYYYPEESKNKSSKSLSLSR